MALSLIGSLLLLLLPLVAALPPQPILTVLQPFGNLSAPIRAAYSFANPRNASDPFVVFGTDANMWPQAGFRVIRRSLISLSTTMDDFTFIDSVPSGYSQTAMPLAMFAYGDAHASQQVCWLTNISAGCAHLDTGAVSWSVGLPVTPYYLVSASNRVTAFAGMAGPHLFWYQGNENAGHYESASTNNYVLDLRTGNLVGNTSTIAMLNGSVTATKCLSSTLCVAVTQNTTGGINAFHNGIAVGYNPSSSALLWFTPLPSYAYNANNLVVGTDARGATIVVGADGNAVFAVDALSGKTRYTVNYEGEPFSWFNHTSGVPSVLVCRGVLFVLGSSHLHALSVETGKSVARFNLVDNSWDDQACFNDTYFYIGFGSQAVFGRVSGSSAAPTVNVTTIASGSGWTNDGLGTAFQSFGTVTAYDLSTGAALWQSNPPGNGDSMWPSFVVHAIGTPIFCSAATLSDAQVECIDGSLPRGAAFHRNHGFTIGVSGETTVTVPAVDDGSCILDTTTLRLIVDTADAAGDSRANSASDSSIGSNDGTSPIFTGTGVPLIVTAPDGMKLAIVLSELTAFPSQLQACIRAFSADATGKLRWARCLPTTLSAAFPVASPTSVFVVDANATMYALDLETGKTIWKRQLPTPMGSNAVPCGVFDSTFSRIYATTASGYVALWSANGTIIWSHSLLRGALLLVPPVLSNGALYGCAVSPAGPMTCQNYDAETGAKAAIVTIENPSASSPQSLLFDGRFFVNTLQNGTTGVAGLYEVVWNNLTQSRYAVPLPPPPTGMAMQDAVLLGVSSHFVAFAVVQTETEAGFTFTSVQVHRLHSGGPIVWQLNSTFTVGARTSTIQPLGVFANPNAGLIAVTTNDVILAVDWLTGKILRVLPRWDRRWAPTLQLASAGTGTLLWVHCEMPNNGNDAYVLPTVLWSYSSLRPGSP